MFATNGKHKIRTRFSPAFRPDMQQLSDTVDVQRCVDHSAYGVDAGLEQRAYEWLDDPGLDHLVGPARLGNELSGRALDVGALVSGTVRRAGDRLAHW